MTKETIISHTSASLSLSLSLFMEATTAEEEDDASISFFMKLAFDQVNAMVLVCNKLSTSFLIFGRRQRRFG
jgi:hypothetical protein